MFYDSVLSFLLKRKNHRRGIPSPALQTADAQFRKVYFILSGEDIQGKRERISVGPVSVS